MTGVQTCALPICEFLDLNVAVSIVPVRFRAAPAEPSTDPNAEEIDKLKKECQNLSERLTEMENNAVSTADVVELVNELGGKDALLALKNAKGKEAPKNVDLKNKVETEEERLMKMSAEDWAIQAVPRDLYQANVYYLLCT